MKRNIPLLLVVLFAAFCSFLASCDDDKTYADLRAAEDKAVNSFLKKGCTVKSDGNTNTILHVDPINVITEAAFEAQDSTTNVEKNEYVFFSQTGIYLQIVRKGCGTKLGDGENCRVICRFHEFNISSDSLQLTNRVPAYEQSPDVMSVSNTKGVYTASFTGGLMSACYGSAVPAGWLSVLPYINLGRPQKSDDEIAMVRIIVPSGQGHSNASNSVYSCFYEMTLQRGR